MKRSTQGYNRPRISLDS